MQSICSATSSNIGPICVKLMPFGSNRKTQHCLAIVRKLQYFCYSSAFKSFYSRIFIFQFIPSRWCRFAEQPQIYWNNCKLISIGNLLQSTNFHNSKCDRLHLICQKWTTSIFQGLKIGSFLLFVLIHLSYSLDVSNWNI